MTVPLEKSPSLKDSLRSASPAVVRQAIRSGELTEDTAGLCGGYLQGNLAILPADYATDFLRFCQRNPKPCPLLAVSDTGDPMLSGLGGDIDVRTDVPGYRIFRDGEPDQDVTDIRSLWRDDMVAFVLGCSFTFEEALMSEGIGVRHIEMGRNVPMYRTSIQSKPAGSFSGEYVVSMRPLSVPDTIRAVQITSRFPEAHGAPIHFGDPAAIGITDMMAPDYGDAPVMKDGEIPVFWACGVTPQVAIRQARPPISITHVPGQMLITDVLGADVARGAASPGAAEPDQTAKPIQ